MKIVQDVQNQVEFLPGQNGLIQMFLTHEGTTVGPILVGGLNSASNGLTALNGDVTLGGTLSAATSIDASGNPLTINGHLKLTNGPVIPGHSLQALAVDPSSGALGLAVISPGGSASGDLTGNFPGPTIAANAVTAPKIASGAVTDDKVATGISFAKLSGVPAFIKSGDAAGGDFGGTFPNPTIGAKAVTFAKIADHTITDAQLDPTKLPVSLTVNGQKQVGNVTISTLSPTLSIESVTANKTLLPTDSGKEFNNDGATGDIIITLPNATAGLNYGFYVSGGHKVKIQAQTGNPISVGGIKTDANVWIQNNVDDSYVLLKCLSASKWTCDSLQGDWNFSGFTG